MKIRYVSKNFRPETRVIIEQANSICQEYSGVSLTLRQLYYQFVARMRGRLWEIRKSVERQKGGDDAESNTAVALRDKKAEVRNVHEERMKVMHVGTWSGPEEGRKSDYTGRAQEAGRRSAESVPIDSGREVKG